MQNRFSIENNFMQKLSTDIRNHITSFLIGDIRRDLDTIGVYIKKYVFPQVADKSMVPECKNIIETVGSLKLVSKSLGFCHFVGKREFTVYVHLINNAHLFIDVHMACKELKSYTRQEWKITMEKERKNEDYWLKENMKMIPCSEKNVICIEVTGYRCGDYTSCIGPDAVAPYIHLHDKHNYKWVYSNFIYWNTVTGAIYSSGTNKYNPDKVQYGCCSGYRRSIFIYGCLSETKQYISHMANIPLKFTIPVIHRYITETK